MQTTLPPVAPMRPSRPLSASALAPLYANTHSESSLTGRQTNALRNEARQAIRDALGAGEEHALIFCGSGTTAAIHRLIDILRLRQPDEPTTVLIGLMSTTPTSCSGGNATSTWRLFPSMPGARCGSRGTAAATGSTAGSCRIFASFSAASTAGSAHRYRHSGRWHRYGGRVFWDYAAAAPQVDIDVSDKDAVFISPQFPVARVRRESWCCAAISTSGQRPGQPGAAPSPSSAHNPIPISTTASAAKKPARRASSNQFERAGVQAAAAGRHRAHRSPGRHPAATGIGPLG